MSLVTWCNTNPWSHTVRDAMCWFVKLWSSLELFGMEFLSCTNTETKENGLIGVSKDRVSPLIIPSPSILIHFNRRKTCMYVVPLMKGIIENVHVLCCNYRYMCAGTHMIDTCYITGRVPATQEKEKLLLGHGYSC